MNLALWIAQGLLAAAFLGSGAMKLFAHDKVNARLSANEHTGLSRGLLTFIGSAELAGAIGIIAPRATDIMPLLTPWAALGLAAIVLLAAVFHIRRRESPAPTAVLLLLSLFVAWGRFSS